MITLPTAPLPAAATAARSRSTSITSSRRAQRRRRPAGTTPLLLTVAMTTPTLLLAARGASAAAGSARGLLPGFLRPAGGLGRRAAALGATSTARFVHGTSPVLTAEVSRAPRRG